VLVATPSHEIVVLSGMIERIFEIPFTNRGAMIWALSNPKFGTGVPS
jgi:hypothetical protein